MKNTKRDTFISRNPMAEREWYNYSSIVSSEDPMYGGTEVVSDITDTSKMLIINFYDATAVTKITQYLDNTWTIAMEAIHGLASMDEMPISNVVYNKGKKLSFTFQGVDFTLFFKKEE